MEIKWFGNNCFSIKGADATVLIDPEKGAPKSDIVISSSDDLKLPEADFSFDWPGEYEARGVLIHVIPEMDGDKEVRMISLEVDGIRLGVVGNTPALDDKTIEEMGEIDILMVPVTMKPKDAIKLVEEIDPKMVIPSMSNASGADLLGFLKEAGQSGLEATEKIKIKSKSDLDSESIVYANLSL